MSDKPVTESNLEESKANKINLSTEETKAPEGSTLRFYQNEKERNAWFYHWFWRGALLSTVPSIFIAKNLGQVLFFGQYLVVLILILAVIRRIRDRKVENSSNSNGQNSQKRQEIGIVEKIAVFIGGVALGMTAISVIVQIVTVVLKK